MSSSRLGRRWLNVLLTIVVLSWCPGDSLGDKLTDKCGILVLSGGGDKGAYEVGALDVLTSELSAKSTAWRVISGVSVGALNGASSAGYVVGDERAWVSQLLEVWNSITQLGVYKKWPFGFLEGLLWKPGLYDNSPLKETVRKLFRSLVVKDRYALATAVNMDAGTVQVWRETVGMVALAEGVIASSSIPGIFPPHQVNGISYGDGGILGNVNIVDAIATCFAENRAKKQEDIVVDIILCNPATPLKANITEEATVRVLLRAESIRNFIGSIRNIERARAAFPYIQWRYLIYPETAFPSSGIKFDHQEILDMMARGRDDARKAIRDYRERGGQGNENIWRDAPPTSGDDTEEGEMKLSLFDEQLKEANRRIAQAGMAPLRNLEELIEDDQWWKEASHILK